MAQDQPAQALNPIAERQPIDVDALPWLEYVDPTGRVRNPDLRIKPLVDPESGNTVLVMRLPPNSKGRPHWHQSDTLYYVLRGEFMVEGEDVYRAGTFRWVKGGFAYGAEMAGPEGAEVLFVSVGPYAQYFPEEDPPPRGRWDGDGDGG
jgi:hypothetical protein